MSPVSVGDVYEPTNANNICADSQSNETCNPRHDCGQKKLDTGAACKKAYVASYPATVVVDEHANIAKHMTR